MFLSQFKDLLVIILIAAAAVSMLTGDPESAMVIFACLLYTSPVDLIVSDMEGLLENVSAYDGTGDALGSVSYTHLMYIPKRSLPA